MRLFGQVEVRYGDERLPPLDSARAESLLAYLLLHRDAPQSRQRLAFLLWPDSTEPQSRTNLRHLLHRLRQAIPDPDAFLEVTQRTLRWRADAPFSLDVGVFEQLLAQADRDNDTNASRKALERAVEVYTADLLEDHYDGWLSDDRERLRRALAAALERVVALCEAAGETKSAVGYAERLVRHDPLREDGYRLVMRLADAHGDRARALRAYHACVTTLENELGVAPSPMTRAAYQAVLRAEPKTPQVMAARTIERARLVGRTRERTMLTAVWRSAEAGRAQLLVVAGEPGVGKTRLVDELRAWCARRGALTAEARSYAAEGALAYGPVVSWLRSEVLAPRVRRLDAFRRTELARLLPELLTPELAPPQPLPESDQRQRLFDAIASAVLGSTRPMLLVADDIQWCDNQTLQLLHYLLRAEPRAPLLVAATLRQEQTHQDDAVQDLLAGAQALDRLSLIELGPLSSRETAELAGVPLAQAERLFDETEGNPLFVVEAVRAGWPAEAALTPKVQAVIEARLSWLSKPARDLVGLASAIGREFSAEVLADASDADEDTFVSGLDELWRRGIVRERGTDAYDFTHDKIREVAYGGLGPVRRRHHRRIAEALLRRHADHPEPVSAAIAGHYERSGAADEAVRWFGSAAEAQQLLHANAESTRLVQHALDLLHTLPSGPGRDHRELELLLASLAPLGTLEGFGSPRLARVHERALELATAQRAETAPPLLRSLAMQALIGADFEAARRFGEQLRLRGERDADDVLAVEGAFVLGNAAFWQTDFRTARDQFELAVNRYRPWHHATHVLRYGLDPKVVCQSRLSNTLWFLDDPIAARTTRDAALAFADEIGHPYSRVVALIFAAVLAIDMGDELATRDYVERIRQAGVQGRQLEAAGAVLSAYLDVLDGNGSAGVARIHATIEQLGGVDAAPGIHAILTRVVLAAALAAGDTEAALDTAHRLLSMGRGAQVWEAEARRRHTELTRRMRLP